MRRSRTLSKACLAALEDDDASADVERRAARTDLKACASLRSVAISAARKQKTRQNRVVQTPYQDSLQFSPCFSASSSSLP